MKKLKLTMYKLIISTFILLSTSVNASTFDKDNCTFNHIKLYGKVKIVDAFADLTIQVDHYNYDLEVKKVHHFANECGKWQIVDAFEDFKVKFVRHNADLKVRFVD